MHGGALQRVDKVHKIGASVTLYWHKIELSGLLTVSFTIYNTERNTEQVEGFFSFFFSQMLLDRMKDHMMMPCP